MSLTLIGATICPLLGTDTRNRWCVSRLQASRMGVRLVLNLLATSSSLSGSPGARGSLPR